MTARKFSIGGTRGVAPWFVLLLAPFVICSADGAAATRTWNGGGANDNWATGANWVGSTAPLTGDNLEFNGTAPFVTTNNYPLGAVFGDITFSADGYVTYGNALTLTNGLTLLGPIGPIAFHPSITLDADQRFTVSRLNASLNLHGDLNLNGNTPTFFMAGTSHVYGVVSGTGGLVLSSGTLFLHAHNTFSGSANIDGGLCFVHGSNPNLNANVHTGGILGGDGSVRRIIASGGTINPGAEEAPGNLSADATATFNAASTLSVRLNGDRPGTLHDQVTAVSVTLGNAALEVEVGFPVSLGQEFRIVNVTGRGPVTGTFGGLPEGATLSAGGVEFEITYTGGNGNDVVLEAVGYDGTGITREWDGGGDDGFWTNPLNWVGNVAPGPGDSLRFTGLVRQTNTNDFPAHTPFGVIDIDTAGFDLHGNAVVLISQLRGTYFGGVSTFHPAIQLANDAFPNFLKLNDLLPGALAVAGDIDLNGATLTLICEGEIRLAGAITGNGAISKGKDRSVRFQGSAPNTFVGDTIIFGGLCHLEKPAGVVAIPGNLIAGNEFGSPAHVHWLASDQVSNTSTVTVFTASSLELDGFDETIHSLCLTGGVANTMSGTLTVLAGVETKPSASVASISGRVALGGAGEVVFNIANGAASPDLSMPAIVSGPAGVALVKTGLGELLFAGDAQNTYDGQTVVIGGILALNKLPGLAAIAGELVIGEAVGFPNTHRVRLDNANQIADSAPVTINRTGRLDLNNDDEVIGPLTLRGGSVITGTGLLTLSDSVFGGASATAASISGHLALGSGATRMFDIASGAEMQIGGEISGDGGITLLKANEGELVLSSANTYSGPTYITGGTLTITDAQALGADTAGTTLQAGVLKLSNITGLSIQGEPLTVDNLATLMGEEGSASWAGPVTLNADVFLSSAAPLNISFVGVISGNGGFTKLGTGTLTLKGPDANTHTGTNRVHDGSLEIYKFLNGQHVVSIPGPIIVGDGIGNASSVVLRYGGHGQLGDTASLMIQSDGVVFLQGWEDTIGSLAGSGEFSLGILDTGALTIGGNSESSTFAGLISGLGILTKIGPATLTLTGNNTYLGDTTVSGGVLLIDGNQPGSPIFVQSKGTLGGHGTVQRINVQAGGTLSPGASPGILHANGNVIFQDSSAVFQVELNGLTPGTGYDRLDAPFGLALGSSTLEVSLGFIPALGDSFTIMNKNGGAAVVGTFAGLSEGAVFAADGLAFRINYTGGDGNDVVLTRVAAPASIIQGIVPIPDNGLQIQGDGLAGLNYVLETAPHLNSPIPWLPVATNTANGAGVYQFVDPNGTAAPMGFYRVSSL